MSEKKCNVCSLIKHTWQFYSGRAVCQECYKEQQKKYYGVNRLRIKSRVLGNYRALRKKV
jgi:hypothetical protein